MTAIERERSNEGRAWKTLFFVSLVNSAQAAIAVVGIPSLATSAQLSSAQTTSLLAALPIGAGVAAAFAGPISDKFGRKQVLLAGLCLLGLSLIPHVIANHYISLLALRLMTGVATGILMGLPSTLLSDNFRKDRQISLSGKTLCGYAIGQTVGIPLGIWLMEWTSFLWVCSLYGLLAIACIPFAQHYLPTPINQKSKRSVPKWFSEYAKRSKETLKDKDFNLIAVASFLSFTALAAFYVSFALWLFSTAELRPSEIAPMYLAGGLLQIAVFTVILRIFTKIRPQLTISISLILNTIIFSSVYPGLDSLNSATVFFALTLGAVSLRIPGLQFLINNRGDPHQKGLRVSLNQTSSHLGKALGSILGGSLFPIVGMHQIALSCGVLTLACSLLFLRDLFSELNAEQIMPKRRGRVSQKNFNNQKFGKWGSSGTHVAN
ncbi:MFS transporter [Pelagicoccus sp. SDUM812002]|uniref:MFS transporter n=1 Tax=Pelagicoccus sp. SDUM812002 TaxID=3041266 RepID=UPI00280CE846|nr:MFS transporter [Pelagicoccus sp. SDUM812002]MDQ8185888.1 MFS transporter [Pelagicoccus sp. SDUM812002]